MKAVVRTVYGPPEVLSFQEVAKPVPSAEQVLVKIEAASVNRSDWEGLIGKPLYVRFGGLFKPNSPILGSDIAGRVEAAGSAHTRFKPGDEVFGDILYSAGGFAEYVCVRGGTLALKPAGLTFEQAAAIPQAGVIALQGLRDKGQVRPGQRVLINGGGGGAGAFALQLAKLYGAEATGVDNAGKLDFMRALGADHVIDYQREDFTRTGQTYDFILDLIAHRPAIAYARALARGGSYYAVGGSVATLLQILLISPWVQRTSGKKIRILAASPKPDDMLTVAELVAAGKLNPVIDRRFALSEVPEALRYLGEGRAKGKVIITIGADAGS